jgi:16S rRNA C1402 N4-methylase RsmH
MEKMKFHEVLEIAESLSETEQNDLVEILQKRLAQKRRQKIAANIATAHREYELGQTETVTVEELIADLEE